MYLANSSSSFMNWDLILLLILIKRNGKRANCSFLDHKMYTSPPARAETRSISDFIVSFSHVDLQGGDYMASTCLLLCCTQIWDSWSEWHLIKYRARGLQFCCVTSGSALTPLFKFFFLIRTHNWAPRQAPNKWLDSWQAQEQIPMGFVLADRSVRNCQLQVSRALSIFHRSHPSSWLRYHVFCFSWGTQATARERERERERGFAPHVIYFCFKFSLKRERVSVVNTPWQKANVEIRLFLIHNKVNCLSLALKSCFVCLLVNRAKISSCLVF
jgi:hypothetical protein